MNDSFRGKAAIILSSFGMFLGLPDLDVDEDTDTCVLQFNDDIKINITLNEERQEIILHSLLGVVSHERQSDLAPQLLEANLFWAGTRGATMSMDQESGQVIIAKALSLYDGNGSLLGGEFFTKILIDLAETHLLWSSFLKEKSDSSASNKEQISSGETNDIDQMIQRA